MRSRPLLEVIICKHIVANPVSGLGRISTVKYAPWVLIGGLGGASGAVRGHPNACIYTYIYIYKYLYWSSDDCYAQKHVAAARVKRAQNLFVYSYIYIYRYISQYIYIYVHMLYMALSLSFRAEKLGRAGLHTHKNQY